MANEVCINVIIDPLDPPIPPGKGVVQTTKKTVVTINVIIPESSDCSVKVTEQKKEDPNTEPIKT